MKKFLLVLIALMLTFNGAFAQGFFSDFLSQQPENNAPVIDTTPKEAKLIGESPYKIVERDYPFFIGSEDSYWLEDVPLYFINDVDDLPYVELVYWMDILVTLAREFNGDKEFDMVLNWDGPNAAYSRENQYTMAMDFDADTIVFDDYNGFLHSSQNTALLDMVSEYDAKDADTSTMFRRDLANSFDRYGDIFTLNLADYHIDLVAQDGKYYVPLQTMSDLLVSRLFLCSMLFNGQCLIMANSDLLGSVANGLTPLGEIYYAGLKGERSKELAEFGYNELCLVLDTLYGLKDVHDITNFNQIFWQIGYDELLKDPDPAVADKALYDFIDVHLDDLHSSFNAYSYLTGKEAVPSGNGPASQKINAFYDTYGEARLEYYPNGYQQYEEVGNTAFITFDEFTAIGSAADYIEPEMYKDMPDDTLTLIIYAHEQINRPDSPIENVVLDLSHNTGGTVDAAVYVLSWFLGDAHFSLKDMNTGAMSTSTYRADVNLDGKFDERDTVADKNLFCLTSPVSFSCGNLVPAALKASDKVTLIGRTSGGGSCTVQPVSTAWGTVFQISGSTRMSFLKNGSFYDIDQGVDPNYTITKPEKFYDRAALVDYINSEIF